MSETAISSGMLLLLLLVCYYCMTVQHGAG